jgi:hypothetical protein
VAKLLDAAGGDERLAEASIRAYQQLDDPWLIKRRFDAVGLDHRMGAALEAGAKRIRAQTPVAPAVQAVVAQVVKGVPEDPPPLSWERKRAMLTELAGRFPPRAGSSVPQALASVSDAVPIPQAPAVPLLPP